MVARQASLARGVTIGLLLALITALPVTGRAQQMFQPSSLFPKLSQPPSNSVSGEPCNGRISPAGLRSGSRGSNSQDNLVISKDCFIDTAGDYVYGNVNIVEGGRTLKPGTAKAPLGSQGSALPIYLYGANQSVDASGKPVDPTLKPEL